MSLIPCTENCVYQKDGYCSLERAATRGGSVQPAASCVHFIRKSGKPKS